MFVRLSDVGAVECLRMSFGGIGRKVIFTEKVMPQNEGRYVNLFKMVAKHNKKGIYIEFLRPRPPNHIMRKCFVTCM